MERLEWERPWSWWEVHCQHAARWFNPGQIAAAGLLPYFNLRTLRAFRSANANVDGLATYAAWLAK